MAEHGVKVLFLGDVCGQPGNRALFIGLKALHDTYKPHFCVVNVENNGPRGVGVDEESLSRLFALGVDAMTTGNHVWDIPGDHAFLGSSNQGNEHEVQHKPVLRPLNFHKDLPGKGAAIIASSGADSTLKLGVVNALGVQFMKPVTPPFDMVQSAVADLKKVTPLVIVDFHAESTHEKEALAWHLDGTASAVLGTHTHVQTMDNRILPKGCGYITDVGMTGSLAGVIGFHADTAVRRQVTQLPLQISIEEGKSVIQGVCLTLDPTTGHTLAIERVYHAVGV